MTIPASSDLEIPSGRPELIPLPHLATARQNNQEDESDSEGIIDLPENGVTGDENENSSLWKRVEELAARLDGNVTPVKATKREKKIFRCVNCASTKRKIDRTNANPTTITEQAYRTIEKENMELKEELALIWIDKHTDVINDYMRHLHRPISKADESSSFPTMRTPRTAHTLLDIKVHLKVALDGKEKAERKITLIAESLHLELSRKSQLASESLRQVEALILSTQRMKQERDKAIENAEKAQRECAVQEFHNRTLTIEKESEAADITERYWRTQQIDELMASKLELQVECRSFLKTNRELERELGEWKAKYESIIVNGELDLKTFKYNFPNPL
ncbi:hypothetical protein BC829DRAFT_379316, partial [Chytridium lagenaria]